MPQASAVLTLCLALLTAGVALSLLHFEVRRHPRTAESTTRGLEGRYVIVNTQRPDDQSIRGWVRRELADGSIELARASYLEPDAGGGVDAVDAGDVLIPASSVSWVQLDVPAPPPASGPARG